MRATVFRVREICFSPFAVEEEKRLNRNGHATQIRPRRRILDLIRRRPTYGSSLITSCRVDEITGARFRGRTRKIEIYRGRGFIAASRGAESSALLRRRGRLGKRKESAAAAEIEGRERGAWVTRGERGARMR